MEKSNFKFWKEDINDFLTTTLTVYRLNFVPKKQLTKALNSVTKNKYSENEVSFIMNMFKCNFSVSKIPTSFFSILSKVVSLTNEYLITSAEKCYFCSPSSQTCLLDDKNIREYTAILYSIGEAPKEIKHYSKVCATCNASHYLTYASKGSERIYYKESLKKKYISFSDETIFETLFLQSVTANIVFNHTTFYGLCDSFNYLFQASNIGQIKRFKMHKDRLIEYWYYYKLLEFWDEYEQLEKLRTNCDIKYLDQHLSKIKFVFNFCF